MNNKDYSIHTFPEIEMYAGDTTEWVMPIFHENTGNLLSIDMSSLTVTLSILPHNISIGISSNSVVVAPFLTKQGVLGTDKMFHFTFTEQDTKYFRGKYTYQIDVRYEDELRICQGSLYVKQNINR